MEVEGGVGTTPLARPVTGSNPPNPLTASEERPPLPLNWPRVGGTLWRVRRCGWDCCWEARVEGRDSDVGGTGASLGTIEVGLRVVVWGCWKTFWCNSRYCTRIVRPLNTAPFYHQHPSQPPPPPTLYGGKWG